MAEKAGELINESRKNDEVNKWVNLALLFRVFFHAKLQELGMKVQLVSWNAVNLRHAFVVQAASCRRTGWGVIQGSLRNGTACYVVTNHWLRLRRSK